MNSSISPALRVVLVVAAFLLPASADYFVFFSLPHYPGLAHAAYGIAAAGIIAGAILIGTVFNGVIRIAVPLAFSAIALVSTWFVALYVAC